MYADASFGLGVTCSAGWYSPATGITIVAWTNYRAPEPVEGVASVIVRDIARIMTPGHVPFVYVVR